MASTPTQGFLELDGGRVHLLRGGSGEPVLFLHAAGGAGEWHEFHALLSEHFDVIAPDHPGFGKSDDFPHLTAIDDLVYHYLDLLDNLGLDRPHVVGASFGGWIAAELAVHSPHRIGTLALLSAAGLRVPGHPVPDIFLMSPPKLMQTLFHTPPSPPPTPPSPPPTPPTGLGTEAGPGVEEGSGVEGGPGVEGEAPGMDVDAILAAYRDATALARFSWVPYLHDPKLERRLRRITAPTLVAVPGDDRLIPAAHAGVYAERIPRARLATIPDCGHAMYFEKPAAFADLVTDFLNGHSVEGVSR
jgi:pimeloyl-ACP methyl ester carboxylesterase